MSEWLVVLAISTLAVSGVPGLFLSRHSNVGQWLTTVIAAAGTLLGLAGVGLYLASGESREIVLPWSVPGGQFAVALDGISAIFLLPIFVTHTMAVSCACSTGCWPLAWRWSWWPATASCSWRAGR
jgi:hypothetical protein